MEKQITVWISSVLLLAALNFSQAKVIPTYFEVGGKLTLRPTVTETIDNILWKYNGNLLAEWVKGEVELLYYDKYKGRTTLNITSGQLEINNMVKDDVGSYTVEINNKVHGQSYDVKWITRVRKPSVVLRTLTCGPDSGSCLFTCEVKEPGSLSDAEPIQYSWKMGEKAWETMTKDVNITSDQTKTESIKTISCRISNPVSLEDSQLKENPMYTEPPPPPTPVGLIVGGIVVLILIAAAVLGWFKRELIRGWIAQCRRGNNIKSGDKSTEHRLVPTDEESNKSPGVQPNNSTEAPPANSTEVQPNSSTEVQPNSSTEVQPNSSTEVQPNNSSDPAADSNTAL